MKSIINKNLKRAFWITFYGKPVRWLGVGITILDRRCVNYCNVLHAFACHEQNHKRWLIIFELAVKVMKEALRDYLKKMLKISTLDQYFRKLIAEPLTVLVQFWPPGFDGLEVLQHQLMLLGGMHRSA